MCNNKELGCEEKEDPEKINWLKNRFLNLKEGNRKLKKSKQFINDETERVRDNERKVLSDLTKQLFERNQEM